MLHFSCPRTPAGQQQTRQNSERSLLPNLLHVSTINPEDYNRFRVPPRAGAHMSTFRIAMDLDSLKDIVEGEFAKRDLEGQNREMKILVRVHRGLIEMKKDMVLTSPQEVTRRRLINKAFL